MKQNEYRTAVFNMYYFMPLQSALASYNQLTFSCSLSSVVSGIGVTFIQPLHYSSFFNRESVYGYSDDFERFVKLFLYLFCYWST